MTPTTYLRPHLGAALCAIALLLGGCSDPQLMRYPVTGAVTLDGAPVDDCTIIFTPRGKGLAAAASITSGQFVLTGADGPTAGDFSIRINPNEAEIEEARPQELASAQRRPRIPKKYQNGEALSATIAEAGQTLVFEMSSTAR